MNAFASNNLLRAAQILLALLMLLPLIGCGAHGVGAPAAPPASAIAADGPFAPHPHKVPPQLQRTDSWLEVIALLGIPVLIGGVVAYFLAPEAHRLSFLLATAGATMFVICTLIRISLWLFPWVAKGCLIVAAGALAWEIYRRVHRAPSTAPGATPATTYGITTKPTVDLVGPTLLAAAGDPAARAAAAMGIFGRGTH